MDRSTALGIGLTILLLATAAFLLMLLLKPGGIISGAFYAVSGLAAGAGFFILGIAITRPQGRLAGPSTEKKQQSKAGIVVGAITAVSAQLVAVIAHHGEATLGMLNTFGDGHAGGRGMAGVMAVSVAIVVLAIVVAAVLLRKSKAASASSPPVHIPWVVALIIGMLILGVVGITMGLVIGSQASAESSDIAWLAVGLAVMLLVVVLAFKLVIVGTSSSAYTLPDVLPAAGPPTDPHFVRGGYWDGTRMLNQRVCGIPVPVMGRGYFIQGHGKAWLADEVLAFHLYLTRKPLVIPYGIIHAVSTKKLILRKNHFPGPGMSIIWGRPDMPMVTTIQVTQNKAENELWAQEIMRRAGVWKEKMAAMEAAQAGASQ